MGSTVNDDSRPADSPLRIGKLAHRLTLTARTLRYWEQLGLMPSARRSPGGFRTYGAEHERAAKGIQRLKLAGLGLDEIGAMQRDLGTGPSALGGAKLVAEAIAEHERAIADRVRRQQDLLADLAEARRCLEQCDGCDGKTFDDDCVDCLSEFSNGRLPSTLAGLARAAAELGR